MKSLRVALVQMCSGADIPENLATIDRLLSQPAARELDLLVLPECFASLEGVVAEVSQNASAIIEWMSNLAKQRECWLVGGSTPVHAGNDKSFASCFVFNPLGEEAGCYNKMHLFDADVEDGTGRYRESVVYQAGDEIRRLIQGGQPWACRSVTTCVFRNCIVNCLWQEPILFAFPRHLPKSQAPAIGSLCCRREPLRIKALY